jgi:hypothetical protein
MEYLKIRCQFIITNKNSWTQSFVVNSFFKEIYRFLIIQQVSFNREILDESQSNLQKSIISDMSDIFSTLPNRYDDLINYTKEKKEKFDQLSSLITKIKNPNLLDFLNK